MLTKKIHVIAALFIVISATASLAEDWVMDPAPADRAKFQYTRKPGDFKVNKYGMIDPAPDVISLKFLPKDNYGFVDWGLALKKKIIAPRDSIDAPPGKVNEADSSFDKDVLIKSKLDFMPDVNFPHSTHNAWLKCSVCHPKIFKMKAGENPISMVAIWQGQFCGRCHDKVAFPIRNCFKCHSVAKAKK